MTRYYSLDEADSAPDGATYCFLPGPHYTSNRSLAKHIKLAKEQAKRLCKEVYVVETDEGEGRSLEVASRRYVDSDEFEAFDGRIIATVYPDGEVEV